MKLAVVGSRTITDYTMVRNEILSKFPISDILEIVSGGAIGVDTLAEQFAYENGIPIKVFLPDWNTHGKKAGYLRNIQIVDYATTIFAFWNGLSKGTKHTIDLARSRNKTVLIKII